MTEKFLVTGSAGFIGFHVTKKLLKENNKVIGLDNLNNYYDVNLKKRRIENIKSSNNFKKGNWKFIEGDLEDDYLINKIFNDFNPDGVVHLAAQAGVRYSITNPKPYIASNIVGFSNIIEACRKNNVKNLIYASSSSVYGANSKIPFKETDITTSPISLYAATKSSNELIAQTYSYLYKIPCTGLRFFTVYGPWGRPDMAPMIFAKSIIEKKPIKIFNYGQMKRDFTYIDDIVEAILLCCKKPPNENLQLGNNKQIRYLNHNSPHIILNVGNSQPVNLLEFVEILENELNISAIKDLKPIEKGDVIETYADIEKLKNWINFYPKTSLEEGIKRFAKWYKEFYNHK